ncbi:MAG: TIM barrel protein [Candidatus Latescibacteria bacterium]|nr:TIM barrel protein [Candidatus Latescibacterota bacterium]
MPMKLSLSVRVAEKFTDKRQRSMNLDQLAQLARQHRYHALCMRASQLGTHTPLDTVRGERATLNEQDLAVSMVTGDFPIPENTEEGTAALRNITPYLDLAQALGSDLLRICMKKEEDITWAQRAADEAAERGLRLAHQCHNASLFEQVEPSVEVLQRIGRNNFGIIYEPANLELCGEEYGRSAIERLAPYMFNVYLQNQRIEESGPDTMHTWSRGPINFTQIPIWDEDGIDFPHILSTLESIGYEGYVTIHQASAQLGTEAAVEQSSRYLRGLAAFMD